MLLELKADPNTKDNEGMVPLMEAARNHSPLGFELMQALVTGGASVELLVSMPPHPVGRPRPICLPGASQGSGRSYAPECAA